MGQNGNFEKGSFGCIELLNGVAISNMLKTIVLENLDELSALMRFGYSSSKA